MSWVLSHFCVTLLCHTSVSRFCVTLLCHTFVSHFCVTLLCHTFVSHLCVTLLCHTFVPHFCVTLLCHTFVSHFFVTLFCDAFCELIFLLSLSLKGPLLRRIYGSFRLCFFIRSLHSLHLLLKYLTNYTPIKKMERKSFPYRVCGHCSDSAQSNFAIYKENPY